MDNRFLVICGTCIILFRSSHFDFENYCEEPMDEMDKP